MNDSERRQLFQQWFSGKPMSGNRELLARKTSLSKGRISQLFDERQPFGERAARSLAASLNLDPEFFNTRRPALVMAAEPTAAYGLRGLWPFENVDPEDWLALSQENRALVENLVRDMANQEAARKASRTQPKKPPNVKTS